MKGLFITYLLLAVGTVGGVFAPIWGAMAYWAFSILRPDELWFWAVSPGRYAYYVAICTLLGWAFTSRFGNWDNLRAVATPLKFLLGYLALSWLSTVACDTPAESSAAALVYTKDILIVLVTILLVDSFAALRRLTWVVVVSVGYVALDLNLSYYTGWNRLLNTGFGGVDNNGMAMVMAMTVPLSLGLGAYEKDWRLKAAALFWAPFQVNAVFFSFSRSGMLGLGAMAIVLFWLLPRSRLKPVLVLLLVVGAMALAGPEVQKRFSTIFAERQELDGSAASRYETWGAAWACIKDHPVLGMGPRGFNRVASNYGLTEGKSVHNLFLQVSADIGVPGSACLLGAYLLTILLLVRGRRQRQSEHPWLGYWVAMVAPGLIAFLFSSQFIGMEQVGMPYFLTGLGMMAMRLAARSPMASMKNSLALRASRS